MSAGLPGVGLSGLFFIVSALLAFPLEIVRTVRGRSSWERWRAVLRHLAIALVMIAVLELTYTALHLILEHLSALAGTPGHGQHPRPVGLRILPIAPVLITLGLIAVLVLTAKLAQAFSRARLRQRGWSPSEETQPRG